VFDWEGLCFTGRGCVLLGGVVIDWEGWFLGGRGGAGLGRAVFDWEVWSLNWREFLSYDPNGGQGQNVRF
jgi:hypothetical protein